jgi:UDP-GlcNAc3NAcA epimerase
MKIVTILGARPQFIKASVVSNAIQSFGSVDEVVLHTGQHFDANMSDVFFRELNIPLPRHKLDVHGGSHGEMTGRMLIRIERVLLEEKPSAVLVYGDTNSTLAGALAAAKLQIPIAHVEAGLRSFNMAMPEEINRILTDRISRWLFTPTEAAANNLRHEGVSPGQIFPVGDVMYDVALHYGARISEAGRAIERLGLQPRRFILATVHRAENTVDSKCFKIIVEAFLKVAREIPVVWPVHPRTLDLLKPFRKAIDEVKNLYLTDPMGYLDMVQLIKHAAVIATDSGGVQKEAFFFRVPCVTLREETEWGELLKSNWNVLSPPHNNSDVGSNILSRIGRHGNEVQPYGDGNAAQKIAGYLAELS